MQIDIRNEDLLFEELYQHHSKIEEHRSEERRVGKEWRSRWVL